MKAPLFPSVAVRMLRAAEQNQSTQFMLHLEYKLLTLTYKLLTLTNQQPHINRRSINRKLAYQLNDG